MPFNISFKANTVYRTTTYTTWNGSSEVTGNATNTTNGAIQVNSVTNGQENVTFDENTVYSSGRTALYIADLTAIGSGLSVTNNKFSSTSNLHTINRAYSIVVRNNDFHGLAGSEAIENVFKNCDGGIVDGNTYRYDVTKTTNYALHYLTDTTITNSPTISNNRFFNTAAYAFQHDPYVSGVQAVLSGNFFTASGNSYSNGYETNGGIDSTTNGYPLYRNQKLFVALSSNTDLSLINALKGTQCVGYGKLMIVGGNVMGASYSIVYSAVGPTLSSRDGSGSGSGIPTSTSRYASFSGTIITVTAPATVQANLELELTSWL